MSKPYLAIDVGGSAIKYGVVQDGTKILYKNDCPVPKDSMESLIAAYKAIYEECRNYGPFRGVAISFTASMDGRTGYCFGGSLEAYTKDKNLLEIFQEVFDEPVAVENDGNCATLAEGRYGSLVGSESAIMIVLGTGIGGGLLLDGKIYHGKQSCSGEFSYMITDPKTAYSDHAETWPVHNGTAGLTERLSAVKGKPIATGHEFFALAETGDPDALSVLKEFTDYLAVGIFNLQCVYAPDRFAIGGGISRRPLLMQSLRESLVRLYRCNPICLPKAEIVEATFRGDSNLIGAVCHWEDFYKK